MRLLRFILLSVLLLTPLGASARALHFEPGDAVVISLREPLTTTVTIEAWIRVDTGAQFSMPVYVGSTSSAVNGYGLLVHDGFRAGTGSSISLALAGIAYSLTGTSVPIRRDGWTHIALVRDDSLWYLYRNGSLAGRASAVQWPASATVTLGRRFDGDLDEVMIWSRARTRDEIARAMRWKSPGDAPGLLASFDMEQADPSVIRNRAQTGSDFDGAVSATSASFGFIDDGPPLDSGPAPRVALDVFPRHMQFFGRDAADSASVAIAGRVLDDACDAVRMELVRDGATIVTSESTVDAGRNGFTFSPRIRSELAQYTVRLSGRVGGEWRICAEAADLIAGDVYVIAGQSNSHPSSPLATWTSPFVRTLGRQTPNANYDPYDPADTLFGTANGHGHNGGFTGPYFVGIWGMRLAQHLIEATGRPVMIVNGGAGGSSIAMNARDDAEPASLATIYGRTLYRCERAGLREHVRAILWHQGESDGIGGYYERFRELYEDWRRDFPSVSHVYVYQIRPGCGGSPHAELRELQRTIGDSLDAITTLATVGLPGHDGCHFTYDGYVALADQTARFVLRDLVPPGSPEAPLRYPDIRRAWFTSARRDEVALLYESTTPLVWPRDTLVGDEMRRLESAYSFDDEIDVVASASVRGDTVMLKLRRPIAARHVSYVPDKYYPGTKELYEGPWLTDSEGLGAFAFAGVAIDEPPASGPPQQLAPSASIAPSPTPSSARLLLRLGTAGHVRITLVDAIGRGRVLLDESLSAGEHSLTIDDAHSGAYRCVLEHDEAITVLPLVIMH